MSSVIYRLQYQSNLTNAEKECARYFIQNINLVRGKSITELAQLSGYSIATISRLCKKINRSGFETFQQQLSEEIDSQSLDANFPFSKDDTRLEVREKLGQLYQTTIKQTEESINDETIEAIIDAIDSVDSVTVYSSPQYLSHANTFQTKFENHDFYVNIIPQQYFKSAARVSGPTSVSFVWSYEDDQKLIEIARILKQQGGKVIVISSPRATTLIENSTYHIALTSFEKPEVKISTFASLLSMSYVLDYIVSCLFMKHYDENMMRILNNS
ncbi:MAG: MurR/RpiR family transcriptional regulator [Erysipelotrichaceae bacterium]|nr:MurR/RpiR family transcriptional regulator [Erysipelotrichaceae bacterium]